MAYVNPYANKSYKPKGNAWWDQRLNEGLFGQTYRGTPQGGTAGAGAAADEPLRRADREHAQPVARGLSRRVGGGRRPA